MSKPAINDKTVNDTSNQNVMVVLNTNDVGPNGTKYNLRPTIIITGIEAGNILSFLRLS
jgi:hypothetical protein